MFLKRLKMFAILLLICTTIPSLTVSKELKRPTRPKPIYEPIRHPNVHRNNNNGNAVKQRRLVLKNNDVKTNVTNISNVYIAFVQEWKNEECYDNEDSNCETISTSVTIHGQWPNYYVPEEGSDYPDYCTSQELEESEISSLESQLDQVWPSFDSDSTNFEFWSHEWTKHGTCWFSMDPYTFFQNGINLHSTYDIASIIDKNGFKSGQEYSYSEVTDALSKGIGATMYVQCDESGGKYIESFYICLDWNSKLINCPQSLASEANDCGETVEFST